MPVCTKCGAQSPEGSNNCTQCGAALEEKSLRPQVPAAEIPHRSRPRSSVLSTGSFLGSLILMNLPIAGLIITIVWACGGTANENRRNLARGYILYALIMTVLAIVLSVIGVSVLAAVTGDMLRSMGLSGGLGDLGRAIGLMRSAGMIP